MSAVPIPGRRFNQFDDYELKEEIRRRRAIKQSLKDFKFVNSKTVTKKIEVPGKRPFTFGKTTYYRYPVYKKYPLSKHKYLWSYLSSVRTEEDLNDLLYMGVTDKIIGFKKYK